MAGTASYGPTLAGAPTSLPGRAFRCAGIGALWALGFAGLVAARLPASAALAVPLFAASAGAVFGLLRPGSAALRHPLAAAVAAGAGLVSRHWPEPTFFILVPLLAAAIAWSLAADESASDTLPSWALPATVIGAAAVFFFQSAIRHWQFASGSRDLGLFYQSHWLMAHGLAPRNTVMGLHAFADHMAILDALLAQLLRIDDGPETLLFVQACAAASGALPLFWLARHILGRSRWALVVAWVRLLSPDVHSAVMFDYNPTCIGSAAILWTAWALVCRGTPAALAAALVTCLAKENLCIYVAVVALVLAWRAAPRRRSFAVVALATAVFVVDMRLLFSGRFDPDGYPHWRFEQLGETPSEGALAVVSAPHRAAMLLVDHRQKRRSLLLPLMTTGYVGLADPLSLVLQLPNWAERFLSTHGTRWWGYHYGMPAAATAALGLILGWRRLQTAGRRTGQVPAYLVSCALLAGVFPPLQDAGREPAERSLRTASAVLRLRRGRSYPARRGRVRGHRPRAQGRRSDHSCHTSPGAPSS